MEITEVSLDTFGEELDDKFKDCFGKIAPTVTVNVRSSLNIVSEEWIITLKLPID